MLPQHEGCPAAACCQGLPQLSVSDVLLLQSGCPPAAVCSAAVSSEPHDLYLKHASLWPCNSFGKSLMSPAVPPPGCHCQAPSLSAPLELPVDESIGQNWPNLSACLTASPAGSLRSSTCNVTAALLFCERHRDTCKGLEQQDSSCTCSAICSRLLSQPVWLQIGPVQRNRAVPEQDGRSSEIGMAAAAICQGRLYNPAGTLGQPY